MKPILNFENYAITLDGRVINNTTKKCKKPTDNHSGNGYRWGVSKQDVEVAIDALQRKINGLQERIDLLKSFICE